MAEEEKRQSPPPPPEGDPHHDPNALHSVDQTHRDFNDNHHQQLNPKMARDKYRSSDDEPRDVRRAIWTAIAILLLLVGVTALILYLVYRPQKPRFNVIRAAIYDLNTTIPPLISTTMQFTLVTRNPNKRVSIHYDQLSAFVSYRNQAITPPVPLPPLHHETKSTVSLSPTVGGTAVPVAADVANGLAMDQAYGVVGLRVVVMGRLKWKAGAIKTGYYRVYVKCDVMVGLKRGFVGELPLLGSPGCKVDI